MPGDKGSDQCAICQERLDDAGNMQAKGHLAGFTIEEPDTGMAIWHSFHPACLNQWIGNHPTCPICMEQVAPGEWTMINLQPE
jgi:hypothetical protein